MATITLKGNPLETIGNLPIVGSAAPDFSLVGGDLSEKSLSDFAGKTKVLNIIPSLDTGTCQASARRFNSELNSLENVVVLNISQDLPFAQKRFCESEGLNNVINLSAFRSTFGQDYGVTFANGPLKGLTSRAIVVLNSDNKVVYTEQVSETTSEPNYEAALAVVR